MVRLSALAESVVILFKREDSLGFFLRWLGIFLLLLLALVSQLMFRIIAVQSNPFFYANF
jgi:hypothetical protein